MAAAACLPDAFLCSRGSPRLSLVLSLSLLQFRFRSFGRLATRCEAPAMREMLRSEEQDLPGRLVARATQRVVVVFIAQSVASLRAAFLLVQLTEIIAIDNEVTI